MNKIVKKAYTFVFASALSTTIPFLSNGQSQTVGSVNTENSIRYIGSQRTTDAESLFIGPNANITLASGAVWDVYSKNVWISPNATISGPGTIVFHNASDLGATSSPTIIDGNNGNYITANIRVLNSSGVKLQNITPTDISGSVGNSNLKLSAQLDLAVDGAIVWLGGNISTDQQGTGDLDFSSTGTIVTTGGSLGSTRMVVTNNSTLSHVVKDQSTSGSFLYPVGISAGDYTPATLVGNGKDYVSVIDYSLSTPQINAPTKGMYRTWHIYGGTASSITLQHNSSTDGTAYTTDVANSFITQYAGSGNWTNPGTHDLTSNSGGIEIHKNTSFASSIPSVATDVKSYLSKSIDPSSPLPVELSSFEATKVNNTTLLNWETQTELNNKGFYVQRSTDSYTWTNLGFVSSQGVNGNSSTSLSYSYTDKQPNEGKNYYRLYQVDLDGKSDYSEVKTVYFTGVSSDIKAYPIPAIDHINLSGATIGSQYRVVSIDGKVYQTGVINSNPQTLQTGGYSSGIYFIQLFDQTSHNLLKTIKFIKK